jgi:hypothetical protein
MRRVFRWISLLLAVIVVVGVVVQVYLIASWMFGEPGALDAHQTIGGAVVHPAEVFVFLASFGAWWRVWRNIAVSFGLALLGTVQVFLVGDVQDPGNGYVHGLHGALALFVIGLAAYIARRELRALKSEAPSVAKPA